MATGNFRTTRLGTTPEQPAGDQQEIPQTQPLAQNELTNLADKINIAHHKVTALCHLLQSLPDSYQLPDTSMEFVAWTILDLTEEADLAFESVLAIARRAATPNPAA